MSISHFTYSSPDGDLKQGDILKIDNELAETLRKYHPHYASHEDYRFLTVVTQSCDLVRRSGNSCKARYISLAAVRPLQTVLTRALLEFQREEFERITGTCSSKGVTNLRQFYARLLNNNQDCYFYFHDEPSVGLESCVAFLRLSIPIRATEHYQKCLDNRIVSLKPEFQAQLGWLVGDIYSRVGTEDWVPEHLDQKEFDKRINDAIKGLCIEIDQNQYKYLQKKNPLKLAQDTGKTVDEVVEDLIREFVNEKKQRPDRAAEVVEATAFELAIDAETAKKLKNRLKSDSKFRSLFN